MSSCPNSAGVPRAKKLTFQTLCPRGAQHPQQFTAILPSSGSGVGGVLVPKLGESNLSCVYRSTRTLPLYTQTVLAPALAGVVAKTQTRAKHPLMIWGVPREVSQALLPSYHLPVCLRRKCWPCPSGSGPGMDTVPGSCHSMHLMKCRLKVQTRVPQRLTHGQWLHPHYEVKEASLERLRTV